MLIQLLLLLHPGITLSFHLICPAGYVCLCTSLGLHDIPRRPPVPRLQHVHCSANCELG